MVDLDSPDLAVAAVHEVLVHFYDPDLAALVILNDSVVEVHLSLAVAGSEDHIADLARQHRDTVHRHSHILHMHVHWVVAHVLLCLVAVGLVGHIVDPASCRLPGVRSRKHHLVFHIHSAAVDDLLVYSLAARNLAENSLGHTARIRSRCQRHCLGSSGHAAGSYRIHSHRIHRIAGRSGHSPDHKAGRSCHIAAAEDSRHCVFAPEPAGAGRSMLDEELGRSWTDRTPCYQSIGCESGEMAYMLQKGTTRRKAAFNEAMRDVRPRGRLQNGRFLVWRYGRGSFSVAEQHGFISRVPGFGSGLRGGRGSSVVVSGANWPRRESGRFDEWLEQSELVEGRQGCSEREVVSGVGEKMLVSVVVVVHRRMEWWHDGCWQRRKRAIFRSAGFLSQDTANQRRAWTGTATHAGIVMR